MLRLARLIVFAAALSAPALAAADPGTPHAASVLRILGPHAETTLAPSTGAITALVKIPAGSSAAALGLDPIAPGIGMIRARSSDLLAFSALHPGLHMEVAPPLKPLLDTAVVGTFDNQVRSTATGAGAVVGIADTGLDVTHPDFIDEKGHTRVAWMIDMSLAPIGRHPDLERCFGVTDQSGNVIAGAVFSGADIDELRAAKMALPIDEVGHGTHVAGIAAGNGGVAPNPHTSYVGFAPQSTLVIARISVAGSASFDEGALLKGTAFLFDRGNQKSRACCPPNDNTCTGVKEDSLGKPTVVNLSLGSEVGPHDGTATWEKALASHVIDDAGVYRPGRALVVAAGNSGSIAEAPSHQSVYVSEGTKMRVPILAHGSGSGGAQIWITKRAGANLSVGLEGPDGEWVSPVAAGAEVGHNASGYNSGVINGVDSDGSGGSGGGQPSKLGNTPYALVLWSGKWPTGTYNVTLTGSGTADLWLSGTGDASAPGAVTFAGGVREGTINLPATHPAIISVGCTVNKPQWTAISKEALGISVPVLDDVGGLYTGRSRDPIAGEICFFSSAGPTVTGVPKPEISAPGGIVVSSMSTQAKPGSPGSVFTVTCPPPKSGGPADPRCFQVDATHAVQAGTSMAAPMVAGTVALLFERDPTLTQDKVMALLQAGAHPFRVTSPFQDQGGPGELDVRGALDALDQMQKPALVLPSHDNAACADSCDAVCHAACADACGAASWITLGADYVAADESTPLAVIVELRTAGRAQKVADSCAVTDVHRADLFDSSRLQPWVKIDGKSQIAPPLQRLAPGLWTMKVQAPRGMGGSSLSVGVTFDGVDIAEPKTVPIGTDIWNAQYPTRVKGGCAVAGGVGAPWRPFALFATLALCMLRVARRRHSG